ncbi:GNAT family protein [Telmatospirillum sp.]|uniref:GNAT family N-acetyltransferase n=1 Tax=Telmatospirillum sp. TaxID=2079197 RepID=UPI00283B6B8E|nr:GNAT family protein [Telmatospirillum sp.]MDR3435023.1 GNAT family protein [Telmatospirillum sp.]
MNTATFSPLHSDRLTVRRIRLVDAPAFSRYRSLPEVSRFQFWTSFDEATTTRMIGEQASLAPDTPGTWFQLVIAERTSDTAVGDLALHFREDDERQVEIGVNLSPDYQHRGFATEAINLLLGYVFETLGKHRASAITDADNLAAARLFRHLGFRQEGHFIEHIWFKGAYGSEYLFAMLAREWQSHHSPSQG